MDTTPTTDQQADEFLARRAAWVAAGRPSDHPYLDECREALAQPPKPATPLVTFGGAW